MAEAAVTQEQLKTGQEAEAEGRTRVKVIMFLARHPRSSWELAGRQPQPPEQMARVLTLIPPQPFFMLMAARVAGAL